MCTDLPKPRALEKEGAGPEDLQDDVVTEKHLQEGTEGSSKDSNGQQGMHVVVQRGITVITEAEEQTYQDSGCVGKGCSGMPQPISRHRMRFTFNEQSHREREPI